jgi:hypothetical protein
MTIDTVVGLLLTRTTVVCYEDLYTSIIIPPSILLSISKFSQNVQRKPKQKFCVPQLLFLRSCLLLDNLEKIL